MDNSSALPPPSPDGGAWNQGPQPASGGQQPGGAPYHPPYPSPPPGYGYPPPYPPPPPGTYPSPPPGGAYPPPPPGSGYPPPPGAFPPPPGAFPPPPGYGYGNYGYSSYGSYGYPPPPQPPRPTTPAGFGNLFRKFWYVTTQPGVQSVATELPTANWRDVWLGILFVAAITTLLGFAAISFVTATLNAAFTSSSTYYTGDQVSAINSIMRLLPFFALTLLVTVPLGFFIGTGITYGLAKLFGGVGSFLELSYAVLLYWVPVQLASAVASVVPYLGGILSLGIFIYSIVLAIFAVAASQRMTVGKATAVVLIPIAVLFLLGCVLFVIVVSVISQAAHNIQ